MILAPAAEADAGEGARGVSPAERARRLGQRGGVWWWRAARISRTRSNGASGTRGTPPTCSPAAEVAALAVCQALGMITLVTGLAATGAAEVQVVAGEGASVESLLAELRARDVIR